MKKTLFTILVLSLLGAACARQPSEKRLQSLGKSYFNKYGRKYKATSFGLSKIATVQVDEVSEVHKALVQSLLTLTQQDGTVTRIHCLVQRDDPFGWKIVSWENLR